MFIHRNNILHQLNFLLNNGILHLDAYHSDERRTIKYHLLDATRKIMENRQSQRV